MQWYQETTGHYEPLTPGQMYFVEATISINCPTGSIGVGRIEGNSVLFDSDRYGQYSFNGNVEAAGLSCSITDNGASMGVATGVYEIVDYEGEFVSVFGNGSVYGGLSYATGTSGRTNQPVTATAYYVGSMYTVLGAGTSRTWYTAKTATWVYGSYVADTGDTFKERDPKYL